MFRKVVFLEILRSPLLTGVPGLQYTVCNATKNEFLTKFLKGTLKLAKNVQEVISDEVLMVSNGVADVQAAAFSFVCF